TFRPLASGRTCTPHSFPTRRSSDLAGALDDPALAALYRGLLAAEARHHQTYVDLATRVAPEPQVRARLRALAAHEASVLAAAPRSEEHTSELQSRFDLVCRLLLEKK